MDTVITFIKGDKADSTTDFDDRLPVNMTGVLRPVFKADGYMIETPGLASYGTAYGPDRGGLWNERLGNHYRLSGTHFCRVAINGVVTNIGTILGSDQASMPYSFSTQAIIANNQFWLYDPVGGMVLVDTTTNPNFRNPIDGVWIDGYYCLTNGSYIYHTSIIAGVPVETTINPLAVAVESFTPTPTTGCGRSVDNKWIVFSRYTTDFYENVGGTTFAFQRIDGRALNVGLVATHAKATLDDIWFFVGSRKYEALSVFAMGPSGGVEKVATRAVEKILSQYTDSQLTHTVAEPRQMDGYSYLIIHLPNEVLIFNYTLSKAVGIDNAWSYLSTGTGSPIQRWRGINGIFDPRIGSWVYGDKNGPNIGKLDTDICTQYDEIQEWYLNTPYLPLETASIDEFEVLTIPGYTATDDATVFLSLTYDGNSYTQERALDYGAPSAYDKRFFARCLGYIRYYCSIRLRGASKSRMVFSQARIKYG